MCSVTAGPVAPAGQPGQYARMPACDPAAPRPGYADQVLSLFRKHGARPAVYEVRELQTALGLVAAEVGVCVVPAAVERFRRDSVRYTPLAEPDAISPIFMSHRRGDASPEIERVPGLVKALYRAGGITFGR